MGDELEQEDKSRRQDPGESETQPVEEKDIEKNPDLEDPRLYSPLLGSGCPALKDRMGEEHPECAKGDDSPAIVDPAVEDQPEIHSDEENPGDQTISPALEKDELTPENNAG